ncbi:hypothetical protein K438DRAFT_1844423, partial [Mycena galopus ATCC 62051]
ILRAFLFLAWDFRCLANDACIAVGIYLFISSPLTNPTTLDASASRSMSHSAPSVASDASLMHWINHSYHFIALREPKDT